MKNIDILLSTYNGERFLSEQIESILSQSCTSWKLFIRDDGSKDNTSSIILEYVSKYPDKIFWINKDNVYNVGVIKSFEALMQVSTAPYIMFCDQDDVWLPFKVEETLNKLIEIENSIGKEKPVLVHTDLKVVDGELNTISESMFSTSKASPQLIHSNINYALLCNCITGCTVMCNAKARENSLPFPDFVEMHDSWVARKVWLEGGKVETLYKSTMLYRQHGYNVVGATPSITLKQRLNYIKKCYNQYKLLYKNNAFIAPLAFIFYKIQFKIKNLI